MKFEVGELALLRLSPYTRSVYDGPCEVIRYLDGLFTRFLEVQVLVGAYAGRVYSVCENQVFKLNQNV